MAVSIGAAQAVTPENVTLREVERAEVNGKVLAVCERPDRSLVLARERVRFAVGEDGKRTKEAGEERTFRATALLADFADALACGLLAE